MMVLMALDEYRDAWHDQAVSGLMLNVREGGDPASLLASTRSVLEEQANGFQAVSNRSIREHSLQVFDRTFAITRVLRLLAILVALIQITGIIVIRPGGAALAFAGVVILTMLAAESFDPRLIWDDENKPQESA